MPLYTVICCQKRPYYTMLSKNALVQYAVEINGLVQYVVEKNALVYYLQVKKNTLVHGILWGKNDLT